LPARNSGYQQHPTTHPENLFLSNLQTVTSKWPE
jgi:hypothetical protein